MFDSRSRVACGLYNDINLVAANERFGIVGEMSGSDAGIIPADFAASRLVSLRLALVYFFLTRPGVGGGKRRDSRNSYSQSVSAQMSLFRSLLVPKRSDEPHSPSEADGHSWIAICSEHFKSLDEPA